MRVQLSGPRPRRPAGDLVEAILRTMRRNVEELWYTTIAPSRYTVYLSTSEYERLEGILPRLKAQTIRALNEEIARRNRPAWLRRAFGRFQRSRPLENSEAGWHVEFLPDPDGELKEDQDFVVHFDLTLPPDPELGCGERTRRVTTLHQGGRIATRAQTLEAPAGRPQAHARLVYEDLSGAQQYELVRESTTIGRGGMMFPVDVRVVTTDEVSREHARIRRDRSTGGYFLIDLSTHGTTIDGLQVGRGFDEADAAKRENGIEHELPPRARIGLAGTVFIDFERL